MLRHEASEAKGGNRSMHTVDFYQRKSGAVLAAIAELRKTSPKALVPLASVNAAMVDDYIALRRDHGAKENSIHKELTTWRKAMRIAKRRRLWFGDIDEVFPVGFSPAYKPRKRFVSPEEFLLLYRAMVRPPTVRQPDLPPERLAELRARRAAGEPRHELARAFGVSVATVTRMTSARRLELEALERTPVGHELFAIVCFSIATSAEWSAIWRARKEDIRPDLSLVRVRGSKNDNRDRPVPILLYAFGLLLDFAVRHGDGDLRDPEGNTYLFAPAHASSFRARLREACARAGIPPLSPNDLRRTHAKWLRLAGVQPSTIAPSMGHADDRMVQQVYGQSSAEELAHVQAAQLAAGPGMHMGLATPKSAPQPASGATPTEAFRSDFFVPRDGIEPPTRGFSIPRDPPRTVEEVVQRPSDREPIGTLAALPGTAPGDREASPADASVPPHHEGPPEALRGLAKAAAVTRELDGLLEDAAESARRAEGES